MDITQLHIPILSAVSLSFLMWKIYHGIQGEINAMSQKIITLEQINKAQDARNQSEIEVLDKAQQLVEKRWENRLELLESAFKHHIQTNGKETLAIAAKLRKIQQFIVKEYGSSRSIELETMSDVSSGDSQTGRLYPPSNFKVS